MQVRAANMHIVVGLAVMVVTSTAVADVPAIVVGVGGETVGEETRGSVSVGSSVAATGGYDTGPNHGYEANARAFTELLAGTSTDFGAGIEGAADVGYLFANQFVKMSGVYAQASVGNRPGLASRRDFARDSYASAGAGFRLTLLWNEREDIRTTWLRFGFGGGLFAQENGKRAQMTGEFEVYMRCSVRVDQSAMCIHVLDMEMVGNTGAKEVVVDNIDLVRVSGLGSKNLHAEVGVRTISNQGSLSISEENETPTAEETVETEDLPPITELGPVVGITGIAGPARLELRGERVGFASLDGDMTIEDRASITGSLALKYATLSLAGFAARTRWWTSKMDPGSSAATGGGELGLATRFHRYDLKASVGLARSFYPVLDGASPDAPAVGFRSSVQVSRAIDL